jgi:hypothetical protein
MGRSSLEPEFTHTSCPIPHARISFVRHANTVGSRRGSGGDDPPRDRHLARGARALNLADHRQDYRFLGAVDPHGSGHQAAHREHRARRSRRALHSRFESQQLLRYPVRLRRDPPADPVHGEEQPLQNPDLRMGAGPRRLHPHRSQDTAAPRSNRSISRRSAFAAATPWSCFPKRAARASARCVPFNAAPFSWR